MSEADDGVLPGEEDDWEEVYDDDEEDEDEWDDEDDDDEEDDDDWDEE